ncbi:MAG TPA: sugar ABC transporter permease [Chthoniobacterales bacterium]
MRTQAVKLSPGNVGNAPSPRAPGTRAWSLDGLGWVPWLAPAVLLLGVFSYLPILVEAGLSLFAADGFSPLRFVGLANFREAFTNADLWTALANNGWYALATVTGKTCLSLLLAVLLHGPLRGRALFRSLFFMPVVLSFVAIGVLWTLIFNYNYGAMNATLAIVGLGDWRRDWLGTPETALPAVIAVDLWKWTGFHVVIYLAGLQSIPPELHEAAALDGANAFQRFWRITVPLLKPFTAVNVLLSSLGAFSVFDLIYVMTQGGPVKATNVAMIEVYLQAFQFNQFGYAAALSVIMLGLIAALSGALLWTFGRQPSGRAA